ncbi:MFS transporter [Nocardia sp. NPDC050710]|uniref:MFS transporter n=1 Tax=Nocardia sp. NPDC050710 TaxID=3157220 RepID=UPI0033D6A223
MGNHEGNGDGVTVAESLRANRPFGYFLVGRSVSLMGSAMAPLALTFAVLGQPGGTQALGYVLAAQMIPMVLITVIGGGIADRVRRSTVLMWSNSLSGLTQCAIAAVLLAQVQVYWIVPLACLNGAATAFTMPALRGALAELVTTDQLMRANSLINTARNIAQIAGPTIAGVIVATSTGAIALLVDAATFLFAAWMMRRLNLGQPQRSSKSTFVADLREGWRYFATSRWLWTVTLAFTLINIIQSGLWQILGPIIAEDTIGANGWGIVLSIKAAGLLLVSVYLVTYARTRTFGLALVGMSFAALPLITLGVRPTIPALAVTAFAAGLVSAYFGIVWETTLQTKVPKELLSRVTSYDDLGSFIGIPVARLGTVALASVTGYSTLAVIGGVLFFLVALAPLSMRSVRSI